MPLNQTLFELEELQTKTSNKKSWALKNRAEMKSIQTTQSDFGEPWLRFDVK